jgi:hypothetical protein
MPPREKENGSVSLYRRFIDQGSDKASASERSCAVGVAQRGKDMASVFLFGVQEPFLFPQAEREMGLETVFS